MLAISELVTDIQTGTTEEFTYDIDAVLAFHDYHEKVPPPSGSAFTTLHFNTATDFVIDYDYEDFKSRFLKYKKGQIEDSDFVGKIDPDDNVDAEANPPVTGVIRMYYLNATGATNP